MLDYDVIVVGGGPAGSTVSRKVAERGYNVLLVEEHNQIGSPVHCTGKISITACVELSLKPPRVLASLKGAKAYSPSGKSLTVERKATQAYVLDRVAFDSQLAKEALKAGATLQTNTRAVKVTVYKSGVRVTLCKGTVNEDKSCRVVVGADGFPSIVARQTHLYRYGASKWRYGVQSEVIEIQGMDPVFAEVYFGKSFAPGFFAWLVPTGNTNARVGLGAKPSLSLTPMSCLDNLIKSHPVLAPRLKSSIVCGRSVHVMPTGGPFERTVNEGVLVVGDAGGQVKPTTGGGLYYGMLCAQIAGATLCKVLENSSKLVPTYWEMEEYEHAWRSRLCDEMAFGHKARALMDSLTDEEIDYLFGVLQEDESLQRLVETFADIDYQSKIALPLIPKILTHLVRKPKLLYKVSRYFPVKIT